VAAGVKDDEDVAVTRVPAAHVDEVLDHATDLGSRDLDDVVGRPSRSASRSWHHEVRPGSSAATNEYGRPGTNWSEERPLRPWT
jgi:hypothetical protein